VEANRILVTGGTGFVGSHLCERLARNGYAVRALVRNPAHCDLLRCWGVEIMVGDLRAPASLLRAVEGIEVIYHIAATFREENISRKEMWDINVHGTQNILDVAVKAGVRRFIHCSTIGVHGDIEHPPANEAAPYCPGDAYQESKTAGEQVVLDYMAKERLPIVVFRPGGIYGPRDMRFLKLMKAIKTGTFVMLGSGKVMYQMIYIDDLIDGILLCGKEDKALSNVYILTGSEATTLNQLVQVIADVLAVAPPRLHFPVMPVYAAGFLCELICKPLGINPPLYRRRVDFFRKTRCFDISKARHELGFMPQTALATGMQRTIAWYQQEGLLT
jgi:nucleoside-diphosphate-sugar epimerase